MKSRSITCLVALLSLCALTVSSVHAAQPSNQIRIATLNCEFLNTSKVHMKFGLPFTLKGADKQKWDAAGFRDAKFKEAAQAVARIIKKIDADLIALCEVGDQGDVEILRQEVAALGLEYPHAAVCDSTDRTTGQHVAVLSKQPFEKIIRTIPGREGYFQELDDPETEKDTGISKGMQVMFQVNERRVNVFVVHLASERGGFEQDEQRIAQASIVRRTYLKAIEAGEHVVVMGDLNDYRSQPTLRRIRGLDDMFPDLAQTGGPILNPKKSTETNEDYGKRIRNHWTYEFGGQRNQIDHVLLSRSIIDKLGKSGINIRFEDTAETIGDTEHLATDHRAVVVEFKLK